MRVINVNLVSKLAPEVISIPRSTCFHEILSFETQNLMENKLLSHSFQCRCTTSHAKPSTPSYSHFPTLS